MIATPRKKRVLKRFNLSSRIRFCIVTDGMVCSSSDVWWCCDGSNDVLVFSDNAVGVIKSVYCYYQRLCGRRMLCESVEWRVYRTRGGGSGTYSKRSHSNRACVCWT